MSSFKRGLMRKTARDDREVRMEIAENKICAAVGQILQKHYPGYKWYIHCKWFTGVVTVKNLSIHGEYGMVFHLSELLNDHNLRGVIRAGGELLERCNLPRSRARIEDIVELKRDLRGNVSAESMDQQVNGGEF